MSCEGIFKDVCHIHARLFDHRAALQGHFNFFAKEFEEKRGERERTRLDQVQEWVTQSKDHSLPAVESNCAQYLAVVSDRIKDAAQACQTIAASETKTETESEFLKTQREARKAVMDGFMEKQCVRSAIVDQQFDENLKILNATYEDLRDKLTQGIPLNRQSYEHFMSLGNEIK